MGANDKSRSRLLRWLQNIVVVVIIGLLAMKLLNIGLFNDRWGWQTAEREVLLKRFNESLMLARTEWLRQGRPARVTLQTDRQEYRVLVNDNGWPSTSNGCEHLWQMLAGGRLTPSIEKQQQQCRFNVVNRANNQVVTIVYDAETGRLK